MTKRSPRVEKLRILLLEDNALDAELNEYELQNAGILFSSQHVETPNDFLEALKTCKPDLILADYNLPHFNALSALKLRNQTAPQIPFIIITGSIDEETAVACMKQGADDYLLKDRLARLGEAVRHALASRRLQTEKMTAEKSLQANEFLYRTLINSSTDMIFLKDDQFRLLLANQALCRFYGKEENKIIGKTDSELMDKNAAARCRETDKEALAENRVHFSEEMVGDRTFETRKFPVQLTDGRIGIGGYIRDITKRKQAEDALRETEARYRLISENTRDVIWLFDLSAMRLTYISPSIFKLRGYTVAEILQQPLEQYFTPESFRVFQAALSEKLPAFRSGDETMRVQTTEIDQPHKDGHIVHTEIVSTLLNDENGKPTHILGVSRDTSERKQAENALRESEERFRAQYNGSPIAVFTWLKKGESFVLQGYNTNADKITHGRVRKFIGINADEMYESRPEIKRAFRQCFLGKSVISLETTSEHLVPGRRIFLTFASIPPDLVMVHLEDITERKQAEEQVLASLREKEVLLKEIHHRVKNNLQVISGLLTLQAAQTNDKRLQRIVKESQSRIWTMALIHQTLYQSGNLADIDMADYIRALSGNLLSSYAQAATPPTVSFDLITLRLVIDKAIPLALIINELLTNTMKHAFPDGRTGEIRIALQERTDTARRAPNDHASTPTYELTVADNGVGLPAGFDQENQKSLGLQLVTMLTQQLNGSLAIESDNGTSVRIAFRNNEKK